MICAQVTYIPFVFQHVYEKCFVRTLVLHLFAVHVIRATLASELSEVENKSEKRHAIALIPATIGMAVAGTLSAVAGAYASEKFAEKRLTEVKRAQIDCTTNNVGCIENRCYTNCGPRMIFG